MTFGFAGVAMAGTSYMRSWQDFDYVFLAALPLFLFSATFYPLAVYPGWLQLVIRCTPALPGGGAPARSRPRAVHLSLLGHAAYLVAMGALGLG